MVDEMSSRDYHIRECNAVEQSDGSYMNDLGSIIWFNTDGEYHNEDGPAFICSYGSMYWYVNNGVYIFDQWCIKLNKSDEDKMMLRLRYA
jgi:hypothetical protein